MMRISSKLLLALAIPMLIVAGCQPYRHIDEDFGNSVNTMIEAQIHDKNAALNPDPELPRRVDGQYGESVMPVYRGDVGDPMAIREDIAVDIAEE